MSNRRHPSAVDRRTGTHILPSNPYRATPPVDAPGSAPHTYTLTQHNPDKGVTICRTTVEQENSWVVTTTTTIHRRHPDIHVTHVDCGTSPGAGEAVDHAQVSTAAVPLVATSDQELVTSSMAEVFASLTTPTMPPLQFSNVIPDPNDIVIRPGMETHTRFYVVFRGRELGVFYDHPSEVLPHIYRVSNAASKVYNTFEAAVSAYTEAFHGRLPGFELAIIPAPIPLAYSTASGHGGSNSQYNIAIEGDSDSESNEAEVERQVEYQ
ncbi:hypothetical protein VNI00_018881 [Paramarasmius palmivorus]|uniref:Ribonuclease H1 N-terminal domain-containing protein n=1 Tax=Paramarasmius palmivorus TaxID=297713 RepID=A0AAW0AT88_9AGAR